MFRLAKKTAAFFGIFLLTIVLVYPAAGAVRINPEELLGTIIREVLKDDQDSTPPPQTGGTPGDAGRTLRASDLIKVEVIRDGVPLRDQPGANGEIIIEGWEFGLDGPAFLYVDPQPINNEGASWYRAPFFEAGQVQYSYNVPYLYVDTQHVRQAPFDEYEKTFLDWHDRGRPPYFNVGDELFRKSTGQRAPYGNFRSADTIVPITLYSEPNTGSKASELPARSPVIDLYSPSIYGGTSWPNFYIEPLWGMHMDMQDRLWYAIVDANSLRLAGWLSSDDFLFLTENESQYEEYKNKVFIHPPSDDEVFDDDNIHKVFIYEPLDARN